MIISRRRDLKVSMGNYESYAFGASVTLSHSDVGYSDEELHQGARSDRDYVDNIAAVVAATCERLLTELLTQEVCDAQELTEEKRSFILAALVEEPKSKTVSRRKT